jgi:hypothetical protein
LFSDTNIDAEALTITEDEEEGSRYVEGGADAAL